MRRLALHAAITSSLALVLATGPTALARAPQSGPPLTKPMPRLYPADDIDPSGWVPNKAPIAVVPDDDRVYLTGSFDHVGPFTGPFAIADSLTGIADTSWPFFDGVVHVVVSDGAGGWLVGGSFHQVGGKPHQGLVRLLKGGAIDPWDAAVAGTVNTLLVAGTSVYVGGDFDWIGASTRRSCLAAYDFTTGQLLAWDPGGSNSWGSGSLVQALAGNANAIFIGGNFDEDVGGLKRKHFASVDPVTGNAFALNPKLDAGIAALALAGTTLYLGGDFTSVLQTPRSRLAAIDVATDALLPWAPVADKGVAALLELGGVVYVGGRFLTLNNDARPCGGAVDATTGATLGWTAAALGNTGKTTGISAFASDGSHVYVAGHFTTVNGFPRRHVARLDPVIGIMDAWEAPIAGEYSEELFAIAADGGDVVLGGDFQLLGGKDCHGFATLDADTGELLPFAPTFFQDDTIPTYAPPTVILPYQDSLFVGGTFRSINYSPHPMLARLRRSDGRIESRFYADFSTANGGINHLAIVRDLLIAGGNFVQPYAPDDLIAVDALTGTAVPGWDCPAGAIQDLVWDPRTDALFVAGSFTQIGRSFTPRKYLAAIDPRTANVLPFDAKVDSFVYALDVDGDVLRLGGWMQTVAGVTRPRFAEVDSRTAKLGAFDLQVAGGGTLEVVTLRRFGPVLLVGGRFDNVLGKYRPNLALLDGDPHRLLDWNPAPNGEIRQAVFHHDKLYVAGDFHVIAGRNRTGFAVFPLQRTP